MGFKILTGLVISLLQIHLRALSLSLCVSLYLCLEGGGSLGKQSLIESFLSCMASEDIIFEP